ncbi:RNA ligase-domain-containing protein [Kickxella alabastrina]|uniref:RNA ligase-domain-containing protein n=1 Tax=Kickxella alabastrina TaxID=61397 RepID=UPI0022209473|nr:RNA ligase-domain-containing protein [Kickxella alabastrina]KAI7824201.1 RNA ligase-domain-containing protein [Kickxella alabastrina]
MQTNNNTLFDPLTEKEKQAISKFLGEMQDFSDIATASKRIVRQKNHDFQGKQNVTSWKALDYLYKKVPCPLPSQARGIFTSLPEESSEEPTILARGYNKFFNINEVPWTRWEWIEENTQGPYEMTIKEDGCLILAAGINDGKDLLVTSKHAMNVPHSQTGYIWMDKHLGKAGKTREEFAAFLYKNTATAVFELCDDEFEEHIMEYPERMRGLYLHGINRNSLELNTLPSSEVTKVADEFGFRRTECFMFDSATDGHEFADKIHKDQMLDGRAIEGFVVRCRTENGTKPFMFKIKYDQPYLMFFEWHNVTKRILANRPWTYKYNLTLNYVAWLRPQIRKNPADFVNYETKGVIGMRKKFLEYHQSMDGRSPAEILNETASNTILIMPVATIGCGKTTLSLALSKLFGCGHVQSDDIRRRKNLGLAFNEAMLKLFGTHDVVIADRNNHTTMMRESLTNAVRMEFPGCQIVALYWSHENASKEDILQTTVERVISRGNKHQTMTPEKTPEFRKIMNGFIHTMVPLDLGSEEDCLVQNVIELDPLADALDNLKTAVDALCSMYPNLFKQPSESKVKDALQSAFDYAPTPHQVVQ